MLFSLWVTGFIVAKTTSQTPGTPLTLFWHHYGTTLLFILVILLAVAAFIFARLQFRDRLFKVLFFISLVVNLPLLLLLSYHLPKQLNDNPIFRFLTLLLAIGGLLRITSPLSPTTKDIDAKQEEGRKTGEQQGYQRGLGEATQKAVDFIAAAGTIVFPEHPGIARSILSAHIWGNQHDVEQMSRCLTEASDNLMQSAGISLTIPYVERMLLALKYLLDPAILPRDQGQKVSVIYSIASLFSGLLGRIPVQPAAGNPLFEQLYMLCNSILQGNFTNDERINCTSVVLPSIVRAFPKEPRIIELIHTYLNIPRSDNTYGAVLHCAISILGYVGGHENQPSIADCIIRVFDLLQEANLPDKQTNAEFWYQKLSPMVPNLPQPEEWLRVITHISASIQMEKTKGKGHLLDADRRDEYRILTTTLSLAQKRDWRPIDRVVLDRPLPEVNPQLDWPCTVFVPGTAGKIPISMKIRNISPRGAWAIADGKPPDIYEQIYDDRDKNKKTAGEIHLQCFPKLPNLPLLPIQIQRGMEPPNVYGLRISFDAPPEELRNEIELLHDSFHLQ